MPKNREMYENENNDNYPIHHIGWLPSICKGRCFSPFKKLEGLESNQDYSET